MNGAVVPMNGDRQVDQEDCVVGLLVRAAEVVFDDSQVPVESAELFLRIFGGLVFAWSRQRWNYFVEFFDDVPADPCTVFHPGFAIAHDLVVGAVEDDVESVSWDLADRTIQLRKSATFVMITAVVNAGT